MKRSPPGHAYHLMRRSIAAMAVDARAPRRMARSAAVVVSAHAASQSREEASRRALSAPSRGGYTGQEGH